MQYDQCVNEHIINEELHKLTEWLGANKLALNISKTKYMVVHTSNRKITYPNLKINNINIERVTQFNFLGVMFNSHMDWSRHINYISMKISRSTGILYRLKQERQTRPNSGGGVAEGHPRFDKGGVAIIFYFLRVKNRTF